MIQPTGSAPGLKKRARMPITAPPTMYIRSPSNMVFPSSRRRMTPRGMLAMCAAQQAAMPTGG